MLEEKHCRLIDIYPINDDRYYTKRRIGPDSIRIRAIEDEDIALVRNIYNSIESSFLLMARCIKSVNGICREDWDSEEWLKFIKSLNWKDCRLFFQEIRRYTYYEKKYNHPIYF